MTASKLALTVVVAIALAALSGCGPDDSPQAPVDEGDPPATPANVQASAGDGSLSAAWGPVADASGYRVDIASATGDETTLEKFAAAAVKEREQVIAEGVKSQLDQRWAAPALAEAWCVARLGLDNGRLSRHSALAVIAAIESFAPHRSILVR